MANIAYSTDKRLVERGDIFYIESVYQNEGSENRAGRPAIIVSNNKGNQTSPVVEVVYLTTRDKNELPTHVDIRSCTRPSTALCEQIDSVAKTRLGSFIAHCSDAEMMNIDIALAISLDLTFPNTKEVVKEVVVEKPVEVIKEVVVEKPAAYQVTSVEKEQLYRAVAERNLFETLYQDLLKKLIER